MRPQPALALRMPGPSQLAVDDERQPRDRERLDHEQQRVARDQRAVATGQLRGGRLARVQRDGRLVAAAPAGQAAAATPARRPPDRRRSARRSRRARAPPSAGRGPRRRMPEHLAGRVPAPVVAPEAPALLAGAVATQDVAGVVDDRRVVERQHLAGHRRSPGVGDQRVAPSAPANRAPRTTSGLTSATNSLPAASSPRLAACAKPVLAPSASTRTSGCSARRYSTEPSCEPLSTTITSAGTRSPAASACQARAEPAAAVPVGDHDRDLVRAGDRLLGLVSHAGRPIEDDLTMSIVARVAVRSSRWRRPPGLRSASDSRRTPRGRVP